MRVVVVCLLLAGCSAAPAPSEQPAGPLVGSAAAPVASFSLYDCTGVTAAFFFSGDAAKAAVPDPFTPIMMLGDRDGAYGELEHRACQAQLNGTSLGAITLALGGAWVTSPAHMTNGSLAIYLMRVVTDAPEVAAFLAWHGLPAQVAPMDDQSVWLDVGRGVHDTSVLGERLVGTVADSDLVVSTGSTREWFHTEGNVTRVTGNRDSPVGDVAEVAVTLDPSVWGTQTTANIFFSIYAAAESWTTSFDHFED